MNEPTYEVGQVINIGYYGGFHLREKLKRKAKITKVEPSIGHENCRRLDWITIQVMLKPGGIRTMFGYASDLKELEENYKQW